MKTLLLIGLIFLIFSCVEKQTQPTAQADSLKQSVTEFDKAENNVRNDCHEWLNDSTLSTGAFVRYSRQNEKVKIEWGNKNFKRALKHDYNCATAPSWIPIIAWTTTNHIGLDYSCGSPCWGTIILPINLTDSVIERMYDFDKELDRSLIAYLDGENYDKLTIENWVTGQKQVVEKKINCESMFWGYCIDSLRIVNDKLYIRWDESAGQKPVKKKIDVIRLDI